MKGFWAAAPWQAHAMFIGIYVTFLGVFGYIFYTKTLPAVGLERILDQWVAYALVWAGLTSVWALFYFFAIFMNLVLSIGEE